MRLAIRQQWMTAAISLVTASLASAADVGAIRGKITFEGTPPKPQKISDISDQDAHCKTVHNGAILVEKVKVKDGALADVFVRIKNGLPKDKTWEAPKEPVVLDQKGCEYHPHVFGMMAGQGLKVVNSDPLQHNIHGFPKANQEFNISQPQKGMENIVDLSKVETAKFDIKCDVHKWMGAYAFVLPHPFFATSGEDGKFEIKNVPPGTYDIELWHESLAQKGLLIKGVKVEAGKATTIAQKLTNQKKATPAAAPARKEP